MPGEIDRLREPCGNEREAMPATHVSAPCHLDKDSSSTCVATPARRKIQGLVTPEHVRIRLPGYGLPPLLSDHSPTR
jgi:hypothetical protein